MQRDNNITCIRGITCLLVVIGHILGLFTWLVPSNMGGGTDYKVILFLRNFIYTFHMPLFMSVSGYLFYFELGKNSNFITFAVKKFFRLIVPFIIMLYGYYRPADYLIGNETFVIHESAIANIYEYLKISTTGALWYLYILFGIFIFNKLLSFFLSFIWNSKITIWLSFTIFAIASFAAQVIFSGGTIHHLLMYNFYFFLGTVVHYYYQKLSDIPKWVPIASFLLFGNLSALSIIENKYINTVLVMMAAICAIISAYLVTDKYIHKTPNHLITLLDSYSMGIYLFHTPIIRIVAYYMGNHSPIIIILATFIIGLMSSILLTLLVRKLHLGFIIGECARQ